MEYIIGILLLISFVGLAVYAVRGGNLMMGMLIMAIIWTVLPLIGNTFATNPEFIGSYPGITDISVVDAITKVFQSGPEGWGNVLVNVVFGAILSILKVSILFCTVVAYAPLYIPSGISNTSTVVSTYSISCGKVSSNINPVTLPSPFVLIVN